MQTGDFVLVGYSVSEAAEGLAALALGEWHDSELFYRGKVGTGFDAPMLQSLLERLEPLRYDAARLDKMPKDILPVRPLLTAQSTTPTERRTSCYGIPYSRGLRKAELSGTAPVERKRLISDADLASIWVTNPTRRLFGKSGATKARHRLILRPCR